MALTRDRLRELVPVLCDRDIGRLFGITGHAVQLLRLRYRILRDGERKADRIAEVNARLQEERTGWPEITLRPAVARDGRRAFLADDGRALLVRYDDDARAIRDTHTPAAAMPARPVTHVGREAQC